MFRFLFRNWHFGYVLFGKEKPIGWERCYADLTTESLFFNTDDESNYIEAIWPIWEKHASKFALKKFYLKRLSYIDDQGNKINEYILMNLPLCKKFIRKHELFNNISSIDLIESIQKNGLLTLKNHEAIGILLGYDSENAHLFQMQMESLENLALSNQIPEFCQQLNIIDLLDVRHIREEKKERNGISYNEALIQYESVKNRLCATSSFISPHHPLSILPLPCYAIDPTSLKKGQKKMHSYQKERKQLTQIFLHPNFLHLVLEKLCEKY